MIKATFSAGEIVSRTRVVVLSTLVCLWAVSGHAQSQGKGSDSTNSTAPSSGGDSQNGSRIFVAYGCYECHGRAAQGGAGTGPHLAPNPIPVPSMIRELRHPNEMPPYSEKTISDAEIADIRAFLLTLPEPPKADSIAILKK